jgi:4-amino-4-deoxy-L-arabinose transferase-like glycosyltransferase
MRSSTALSWLRREWRWLLVSILVVHFVLGTIYSIATPIWEGPDELGHYRHVRFLVRNLSLPGPEDSISSLDQLTHPPLYYIVTAVLTSWVDMSVKLTPIANPFAATGTMEGGANRFIHSDAESFPYQGTVLAVHAARLVSVAIGTLSLLVTYRLGRLLFPQRYDVALGATAINAFSPGFLYMSAVVNNDIMVTLWTALTLFFSVRILVRDAGWKDLLALGISAGLAILSKYNALALTPLVLIAAGAALTKRMGGKKSLVMAVGGVVLLLLSMVLVSSWWFMRSMALFGTATTRSTKILTQFLADLRDPMAGLGRIDWTLLPDGLSYFYRSFWGIFGWGNVNAATWVYQVLGLLCLAGLLGLVLFLLGKTSRSHKGAVLLLLLAFVLFSLLAIYRTLTVGDPVLRGRYALPTISGVSVLLSLGVVQLTPRRLGRILILVVALVLLFTGLIAPFRYIMPVYARPQLLSAKETLAIENPLSLRFGEKIELVGYELGVTRATAGQFVPVTLYWRALADMEENYTVGLSLLGPDGEPYGQAATFPGHGNYPTSLWKEGQVIKDLYHVRVSPMFPAPGLARIYVAVYTYPGEVHLPILDDAGTPVDRAAIFGSLPVDPAESPAYSAQHELDYQVSDRVALEGYDLEESLFSTGYGCVTLYWRALSDITEDYSVFIHVLDEQNKIVAQSDSQPRGGSYPTGYWREGEIIADQHCISFPTNVRMGSYRLFAGMYLLENMERLPVFDATGMRIPSDQCLVCERTAGAPSHRSYVPLVVLE